MSDYARPDHGAADATWLGASVYTRPNHDAADASWTPLNPRVRVSLPGTEGQISAHVVGGVGIFAALPGAEGTLSAQAYLVPAARISLPGAEGVVSAMVAPYEQVSVSLLGPEGQVQCKAFNDWTTATLPGRPNELERIYYVCEIRSAGFQILTVPMSSFQTTLRPGTEDEDRPFLQRASSYFQIAIPGADLYMSTIRQMLIANPSTTSFLVYRFAKFANGQEAFQLIALGPLQNISYNQGPTNATITLQTWWRDETFSIYPKTKTIVITKPMSVSVAGGYRVRSALEWWVRPGTTVKVEHPFLPYPFTVEWVNMYVNADTEYMDIGGREL
jgi:hypothetical protein